MKSPREKLSLPRCSTLLQEKSLSESTHQRASRLSLFLFKLSLFFRAYKHSSQKNPYKLAVLHGGVKKVLPHKKGFKRTIGVVDGRPHADPIFPAAKSMALT